MTVWIAVIELSTGKGVAANAGHEHPVICRKDGRFELVTYKHSPAVGLIEDIPYKEHSFELSPGDRLFVYTDGVPEANDPDGNMFEVKRMIDALNEDPDASPEQILGAVRGQINIFVREAEQFDDLTMLCLEYKGPQKDDKEEGIACGL